MDEPDVVYTRIAFIERILLQEQTMFAVIRYNLNALSMESVRILRIILNDLYFRSDRKAADQVIIGR